MEAGCRVVRGPDWKWDDQDGGEGHVGTVVVVGKSGKTAVVQWDDGTRANYRCGFQGAFDLCLFDDGPIGDLHTNVPCNECEKQEIEGMRWECCDCVNYNLCSLSYMNDKHLLDHGFNRVEAQGKPGVFVGNRRGKCKVQARGIFPGAQNEALNIVVSDNGIEEHSFLSALSAPSTCIGLHEKLEGEPCESSNVDLANSRLAKVQNKQETKNMHQYADVCQFKSEEEDPDNCDSMDGIVRRPENNMASKELFREFNECPATHIAPGCHPQCLNTFEEMEVSVAEGIGVRAARNSGLHPFALSKEFEASTCQNHSFELQEEINELKEQLRQSEAENQTLKAKLGQYQFIKDREKRWRTLLSEPRASASDESRCCGASTSFKCVSANGTILGGAASLRDKPDFNLQGRFIEISDSLLAEEFKQMKNLARGKVNGFRLAKMKGIPTTPHRATKPTTLHSSAKKDLAQPTRLRECHLRASASDESRCFGASTSSKCVSSTGRLLGGAASLQGKPGFNSQARFIDISNSLSADEFKQMKNLARGKVDGFKLHKMKVGFELLKEVERVSEHPCTDIGELLKGIQRFDLLEKLGLPSPESKTSGMD